MAAYAPLFGHDSLRTWHATLIVTNDRREWFGNPSYATQHAWRQHSGVKCARVSQHCNKRILKQFGVVWCGVIRCTFLSFAVVSALCISQPEQDGYVGERMPTCKPQQLADIRLAISRDYLTEPK